MPTNKRDWTAAKFERYQKEGRGQGTGRDYKPWITIQDSSSKGRSSRTPSWKTGAGEVCAKTMRSQRYPLFFACTDVRSPSMPILSPGSKTLFCKTLKQFSNFFILNLAENLKMAKLFSNFIFLPFLNFNEMIRVIAT